MSSDNAELVFNLWATLDGGLGYIYALSGKAYKVSGNDQEKLAILKMLAATDYITAKRYRVPDRFAVQYPNGVKKTGYADLGAVSDPHAQLFESIFKNLEHELPPIPKFDPMGNNIGVPQQVPDAPLCVTTILYEDDRGNIHPIISQADMGWLAEQLKNQLLNQ